MDPLLSENLITTKSASELSGYTSDYLSRLIRSGKISGKKIGHSWLVDSASLESFLNSQKNHNLDRARELAEARAKEYRTHRTLIRRVRNDLTKAASGAESVLGPVSFKTHAFALSLAFAIVASGAVFARAGVLQTMAGQAAHVAFESVSGFNDTFRIIPSRIAAKFSEVKSDMQARPSVIGVRTRVASSQVALPVLAQPDLSFMRMSTECSGTSCARPTLAVARTSQKENKRDASYPDFRVVAKKLAMLATSPASLGDMLAQTYVAIGDKSYAGIHATFGLYRKGIEQSGRTAFGFAVDTRDLLRTSPRAIASIAGSYVGLTHAIIDAEVAGAYGIAATAPASAHLVVDILGTSGSMLAYAASRAPAATATMYLAVVEMPSQAAPQLARAVFAVEYAGAQRFVAASRSIADTYLSFLNTTGRLAYDRATVVQKTMQSTASVLASAPASIQDAYLRTIGQTAVAVDILTHLPTLAAATVASYPSLSIGERAAVATYETIQGLFGSLTRNFASLFAPSPTIVLVDNAPVRTASTTPATLATPAAPGTSYSYPTYTTTTVVQGVSPATLERSLSSLRSDILGSVSGMIRPVASQTATNQTTIQYVNMIQDLTGLIVRNGDFRGGIFDSGSLTNGFSVSASEGTFGSLTAGSTTLAKTSITGNLSVGDNFIYDVITSRLGLGTTSPFSKLSIAGSPGGTENILAISTSTAGFATSTVLTIDQNGDVALLNGANLTAGGNLAVTGTADHTGLATFRNGFLSLASSTITSGLFSMNGGASTTQLTTTGSTYLATAGGNVGIGTTSPYSKLSVWGSGTGATALFELTNSASTTLASVLNDGTAYMRGKLGIGTTSPTYKFSVEGSSTLGNQAIAGYFTATSTTATSTFAGFIDVNGTGANATSTFASNLWVKGTLRTGTGSLFMNDTGLTSSDGNLSLQRNGISYLNGGNVGIGTTSPYSKLSVWGSGTGATALFELTNSASTTLASVLNDGTAYMRGSLGIGTTSPYRSLSVNGSGVFTGGDVLASTLTATSTITSSATTTATYFAASTLGFAGAPAFTFSNDLNTGLWSPTADTLALSTGGSERLRVDSSGNVGIGTTSPWAQLSVNPNGITGPAFVIGSSTATNFIVTNAGNVGIGTTSPSSALAVAGSLMLGGTTGATLTGAGAGITFTGTGNHDITATGGTLRLGSNTVIGNIEALDETIDIGTPAVRFDKVYASEVNATTLVGTIVGGNVSAETLTINSDNATADTENGYLSFERGSVTPNAVFSWNAAGSAKRFEMNQPLFIQNASASTTLTTFDLKSVAGQTADIFRIASSSGADLLNFTASGNLGIGTTSPTTRFSVQGNSYVSGTAFFGGAITATSTVNVTGLTTLGNASTTLTSIASGLYNTYLTANRVPYTTTSGLLTDSANLTFNGTTLTAPTFVSTNATSTSFFSQSLLANVFRAGQTGTTTIASDGAITSAATSTGTYFAASTLGFAGAPAFTFSNDLNTGLWSPTADTLALSTGGSERLRVNSSGNVGIGTTTPEARLVVSGGDLNVVQTGATDTRIRIQNSTSGWGQNDGLLLEHGSTNNANIYNYENGFMAFGTNSTERMRITSGGYVGIGTTTPSTALTVNGDLTVGSSGAGITLADFGRLNVGITGDTYGALTIGDNATPTSAAGIYLRSTGTAPAGISTAGAPLAFYVGGPGTTEAMRISAAGSLGIGTTSPTYTFSVEGSSTLGNQAIAGYFTATSTTATSTFAGFIDVNGTGANATSTFASNLWVKGTLRTGTGSLFMNDTGLTSSDGNLSLQRNGISYLNGGNVGIGTTSPSAKLSVKGGGTTTGRAFVISDSTDAEKLTVLDSGNIGIGTTTPWGQLSITNTGSGPSFVVEDATSPDSTPFIIDASGNVGIGTASPGFKLDVNGNLSVHQTITANAGDLYLTSANNQVFLYDGVDAQVFKIFNAGTAAIQFGSNGSSYINGGNVGIGTTSPYAKLSIAGSAGGTTNLFALSTSTAGYATTTAITVDQNGNLSLTNGANLTVGGNLTITGATTYTGLSTFQNGFLSLASSTITSGLFSMNGGASTTQLTTTGSTYLATAGGNVGIGTASPSGKLEVWHDTASILDIHTNREIAGDLAMLRFSAVNAATTKKAAIFFQSDGSGFGNGDLLFAVDNAGDTGNVAVSDTKMTILKSGNVGIGTTSPWAQLSVNPNGITGPAFVIGSSTATNFIVTNAGNVGIGTTTPAGRLSISDGGSNIPGLIIDKTIGGSDALRLTTNFESGNAVAFNPFITGVSNSGLEISLAGTQRMVINSSGSVGIGTTVPDQPLHVAGNARYTGNIFGNDASGIFFSGNGDFGAGIYSDSAGTALSLNTGGGETVRITSSGNVGIGTTSPSAKLSVKGGGTTTGRAFVISDSGDAEKLTVLDSGNVGIGTTSPYRSLSVNGSGVFTGGDVLASTLTATSTITSSATTTATYFAASTLGFAGAPAFTFSNDLNTGLWSPTADTLALSTAGSERLRVDSSGNVGIGTTTPAEMLDVFGSIRLDNTNNADVGYKAHNTTGTGIFGLTRQNDVANATLQIAAFGGIGFTANSSATVAPDSSTSHLFIATSGNLGIGTTSPETLLAVQGATALVKVNSTSNGAWNGVWHIAKNSDGSVNNWVAGPNQTADGVFQIGSYTGGVATPSGGTVGLNITTAGNVGIGTTTPSALLTLNSAEPRIRMNIAGTNQMIINHDGTTGTFRTESATPLDFGTSGATKMTITAAGNVGIGTTSPYATLSVDDALGSGGTSLAINNNFKFRGDGQLTWGNNADAGILSWDTGKAIIGAQASNDFALYAGGVEKARITTGGNVGIGTTTPDNLLSIKGSGLGSTAIGQLSDATTYGAIGFTPVGVLATTNYALAGTQALTLINAPTAGAINFRIGNTNKVVIDTNGNVGIGTTTPSATLTVSPYGSSIGTPTNGATSFVAGTGPNGDALGLTAGSYLYPFEYQASTGNILRFQTTPYRRVAGSDWKGAAYRMQLAVDNSFTDGSKAYIEVGASDPSTTTGGGFIALGTAGSDRLVVNNAGNVGIGTTSPSSLLHIAGSTGSTLNTILEPAGWLGLKHRFGVQYSGDTSAISNNALLTSATAGTLDNTAQSGSALILGSSGSLNYVVASAGSGTRTFSSRLFIGSSGNVGIGTTTPTTRLDILSTNNTSQIRLSDESTDATIKDFILSGRHYTNTEEDFAVLNARSDSTANTVVIGGEFGNGLGVGQNTATDIVFKTATNNTTTVGSERMRITSSGNVGIGTTTPSDTLHISKTTTSVSDSGGLTVTSAASPNKGITFGVDTSANKTYIYPRQVGVGPMSMQLGQSSGTQLFLHSDGNVGIGTTNPGAKLAVQMQSSPQIDVLTGLNGGAFSTYRTGSGAWWHVGKDDTLDALVFSNGATPTTTESMVIRSSGNVGIGTTSPSAKLDVYASDFNALNLTTSNSNSHVRFHGQGTSAGGLIVSSNNLIRFDTGGTLSSIGTERMRIDSSGNVGIGTTTPNAKLVVLGGTGAAGAGEPTYTGDIRLIGNSGGAQTLAQNGGLEFKAAIAGAGYGFRISNPDLGNSNTPLVFEARNSSATWSEMMRIMNTGNVGIGTTSPLTRLEVNFTGATYPTLGTASGNFAITGSNSLYGLFQGVNNSTGTTWLQSMRTDAATAYNLLLQPVGGNVGIGTTTPEAKLVVSGGDLNVGQTGATDTRIRIHNSASGWGSSDGLLFELGSTNNTNIWNYENGSMNFGTANTERMRITNGGNVGIGTTTPAAGLQVVYVNTTAPSLTWGATSGQILRSENSEFAFGLSNASPYPLYLQGRNSNSAARDISMQPLGGGVLIGATVNNVYDQVAGARPLVVQKSDTSTTLGGSTAAITVVNGDTTTNNTAQINFAAITGASTNQYSGAIISAIFGARTNAQYPSGQLAFLTSTATNFAPTEKMRIDNNGNIGIGVTSPLYKLSFATTTTDARYAPLIAFSNTTNPRYTVGLGSSHTTGVGQALNFYAGDSGGNTTELGSSAIRMSITGAGNVGIGTTSPGTKLELYANQASAFDALRINNADTNGNGSRITFAQGTAGQVHQISSVYDATYGWQLRFGYSTNNQLNIDDGGNVGIGTTTPYGRLSATGAGTGTGVTFVAANSSNAQLFTVLDNGTVGVGTNTTYTSSGFGKLISQSANASSTPNFTAMPLGTAQSQITDISFFSTFEGTADNGPRRTADIVAGFSGGAWANEYLAFGVGFGGNPNDGNLRTNEKLRIQQNGNVGIGTTTPATKLQINSATQFDGLTLNNGSNYTAKLIGNSASNDNGTLQLLNGGTTGVNIVASGASYFNGGNVGIGTTTPSGKLDIYNSGNTTLALTGTNIAGLNIKGDNGNVYANINTYTDGTLRIGASTNAFDSSTTNLVLKDGNVGIGDTTPDFKLDVTGDIRATANIVTDSILTAGTDLSINSNTADRSVLFKINSVEKMRVNSTGNVGIGTTSPFSKFAIHANNGETATTLFAIASSTSSATTTLLSFLNNGNLGLGTTSPSNRLSVTDTVAKAQFSLAYDGTRYSSMQVDASGNLIMTTSGGNVTLPDDNMNICQGDACPTSTATSTAGNLFVENAVTIGDGFSLRQVSSTELGLYNTSGQMMVIFDNGI